MSRFELKIYCTNPRCDRPENRLNETHCANCETPITYRYLWAVDNRGSNPPVGSIVGKGRYRVVAPQIWLDLQPGLMPYTPPELPEDSLPYLHLYKYRLHLPEVYGFCEEGGQETLLLENVPLDGNGTPYLTLLQAFGQTNAVRQVYWLWQMLELWEPLLDWQVASSLLDSNVVRVHDWRIRLRELRSDETEPKLSQLAAVWSELLPEARSSIAKPMQELCVQMHDPKVNLEKIRTDLNQLLLEQSGQLSVGLQVFGATDVGKIRDHNEDTCFPIGSPTIQDDLLPRLSLVCDGIGGHEGGEVASHMAVQSLKPQLKAFLAELAEQTTIVPPEVIGEQLAAIVRVVNNLISTQNDMQERSDRRRMGTTLVMALQLPQRVRCNNGTVLGNSNELYLINVGDSRAYWMTPRGLHPLSIDDDVSVREVRMGRSIYRDALQRPDAGALTQALGTRDGDLLRPSVTRFLIEDDGILLLCSDGLSDQDLVEASWTKFAEPMIRQGMSLEDAAQAWIDLANEKNGTDNISLVLTRCQVSDPSRKVLQIAQMPEAEAIELAEDPIAAAPPPKKGNKIWLWAVLFFLLGGIGVGAGWSVVDPAGFGQLRDRVVNQVKAWLPQ
jgi:protein phosphatase